MAPKKQLPKNEAAAKELGLTPMTCFFNVKKKKGRPVKKVSNAGRPASEVSSTTATATAAPPPPEQPKQQKVRLARQNWAKGENLKLMREAAKDWELECAKPEKERMSLRRFADTKKVPYQTFQKNTTENEAKRVKVGDGPGRKPLMSRSEQEVIVDVLRLKDRANDGVTVGGAVDILETMRPDLTRAQLDQCLRRTVRRGHAKCLTNPVAAQATTTKRTQINVHQQWRWHMVPTLS